MKRHIVFTDLHGNYNLWKSIQNYYDKDDTLIFLGDALDRGPDGLKIMQEMFEDERIIYLKGNHEDMLLQNIEDGISNVLTDPTYQYSIKMNGQLKTLEDFRRLNFENRQELIENIKNTDDFYIYINKEKKNIFLSHAGIDIENINFITQKKLLWDREHIKTDGTYNDKYSNWYVIHGHTPCQTLNGYKNEIYIYRDGHKIDLDLATFSTKMIATLDLDTFELKYFVEESSNERSNNE